MIYHLERAIGLHPQLCAALITLNFKSEYDWKITYGYRSSEEQDVIYAQGRTVPGFIVTDARGGSSPHNYGLAVDLQPSDDKGANVSDSPTHPAYAELDEIAPAFGLRRIRLSSGEADHPHLEVADWTEHKDWLRNVAIITAALTCLVLIVR